MLPFMQKKEQAGKSGGKRILIKINVVGSPGPIRLVVNEEEVVVAVIETALKTYSREDRLPVLGTKFNDFFLYTPIVGTEALGPWEMIGSFGVRNFMLWKKPGQVENMAENTRKRSSRLKSWLHKSLSLKVNQ